MWIRVFLLWQTSHCCSCSTTYFLLRKWWWNDGGTANFAHFVGIDIVILHNLQHLPAHDGNVSSFGPSQKDRRESKVFHTLAFWVVIGRRDLSYLATWHTLSLQLVSPVSTLNLMMFPLWVGFKLLPVDRIITNEITASCYFHAPIIVEIIIIFIIIIVRFPRSLTMAYWPLNNWLWK